MTDGGSDGGFLRGDPKEITNWWAWRLFAAVPWYILVAEVEGPFPGLAVGSLFLGHATVWGLEQIFAGDGRADDAS